MKRNLLDLIVQRVDWLDAIVAVRGAINNNLVSDTTGFTPHEAETGFVWNSELDS